MRPEKNNPQEDVRLIRIAAKDIFGNKKVYTGLTEIKGISWMFSNAICNNLKIDKFKRIDELTEKEIKAIEDFISHPDSPLLPFLKNRRKDKESGVDKHLIGADLDLQKEFDIKGMKKMKSYKGIRHTLGQPVRGQRTKSHFRKNKSKSGGIKKKN
jgi:small subunit ribosomal protein S13